MTDEDMIDRDVDQEDSVKRWSYDAAVEQAETCSTLEDLQAIVHNCAWMTSQQSLLLRTAILAYYNDGSIPKPTSGHLPSAERSLEEQQRQRDQRALAGDATRTMDDVIADELQQSLRLNQVHLHAQLRLSEQLGAMYQEIVSVLTERISNLPKYTPSSPEEA